MIFEGLLNLCSLSNVAPKGLKPSYALTTIQQMYYGNRVVGYRRQYAALGANQSVDKVVRVWRYPARIGMYAVLENDEQDRIDFVQDMTDEDGLEVTDLTLSRLEDYYDVAAET